MDLVEMRERCRRGQWTPESIDWSRPPPTLSRADEELVVQYFLDMAGIEGIAAALFREQGSRTDDPVLTEIFASFVRDEERHAVVARRLAKFYDVHHYRDYVESPELGRFARPFLAALCDADPEMANIYVTTGELILDIAFLRSLADYLDDPTCADAMRRINRDESRHLAVDYHMVGYYASPAWAAEERRRGPLPARRRLRGGVAVVRTLWFARPFFQQVIFGPMDRVDPTGRRVREAFKHIQLLGSRPDVSARPFPRFVLGLQRAWHNPAIRRAFGPLIVRALGVDARFIWYLYNADEARAARAASYDQLAREAQGLEGAA